MSSARGFSFTELVLIIVVIRNINAHLHPPPHNLSCFYCSTLSDGDSCKNLHANSSQMHISCDTDQIFCSVIRLEYTADGSKIIFWSVERNCSTQCEEGCIVLGERIKLYLCRSCCTGYLCNYGNNAQNLEIHKFVLWLALSLLFTVFYSSQIISIFKKV